MLKFYANNLLLLLSLLHRVGMPHFVCNLEATSVWTMTCASYDFIVPQTKAVSGCLQLKSNSGKYLKVCGGTIVTLTLVLP